MDNIQCSAGSPCTAVQLLVQRNQNLEERMDKLEEMIESLRNRLPLWATMLMTAGGGTIGLLAGLLNK